MKYILELEEDEINSIVHCLKTRAFDVRANEVASEWRKEYRRLGDFVAKSLQETRSPIEKINQLALNADLVVEYAADGAIKISNKA